MCMGEIMREKERKKREERERRGTEREISRKEGRKGGKKKEKERRKKEGRNRKKFLFGKPIFDCHGFLQPICITSWTLLESGLYYTWNSLGNALLRHALDK